MARACRAPRPRAPESDPPCAHLPIGGTAARRHAAPAPAAPAGALNIPAAAPRTCLWARSGQHLPLWDCATQPVASALRETSLCWKPAPAAPPRPWSQGAPQGAPFATPRPAPPGGAGPPRAAPGRCFPPEPPPGMPPGRAPPTTVTPRRKPFVAARASGLATGDQGWGGALPAPPAPCPLPPAPCPLPLAPSHAPSILTPQPRPRGPSPKAPSPKAPAQQFQECSSLPDPLLFPLDPRLGTGGGGGGGRGRGGGVAPRGGGGRGDGAPGAGRRGARVPVRAQRAPGEVGGGGGACAGLHADAGGVRWRPVAAHAPRGARPAPRPPGRPPPPAMRPRLNCIGPGMWPAFLSTRRRPDRRRATALPSPTPPRPRAPRPAPVPARQPCSNTPRLWDSMGTPSTRERAP
jgi:translation initiation factor IF-2